MNVLESDSLGENYVMHQFEISKYKDVDNSSFIYPSHLTVSPHLSNIFSRTRTGKTLIIRYSCLKLP